MLGAVVAEFIKAEPVELVELVVEETLEQFPQCLVEVAEQPTPVVVAAAGF